MQLCQQHGSRSLSFSTVVAVRLVVWQASSMKNKNMRELEKQWAEKAKKAAKPKQSKAAPKKKSREDGNQAASRTAGEATKDF